MLIDFDQLRRDTAFIDILDLTAWVANGIKGGQLRGPCPFHGSSAGSTSLSISLTKKCFQCFKCKEHGNHLEFYAKFHRIGNFADAMKMLCKELKMGIPSTDSQGREIRCP
jgi:DNA primase